MAPTIGILSNTADLGVMVVRNLLVKLLRERHRDARLVLLAEAAIVDRVRRFHQHTSWIDECAAIRSERPGTFLQRLRLCRELRAHRFDAIVLGPRSRMPAWIPYLCGIPTRVGLPRDQAQRKYLTHPVTLDVPEDDRDLHWSSVLAGYARALGLDQFEGVAAHVPFMRVTGGAPAAPEAGGAAVKVAVHAGGNPEWNRRWPLENFVRICRQLAREPDVALFLIGTSAESFENQTIAGAIRKDDPSAAVFDVSGGTIDETARCIAGADLFLGNDSGPMNIAVAVGTPIVAIRGADPENFRPDRVDGRHIVLSGWNACSRFANGTNDCDRGCPVAYDPRTQDYPKCMAAISCDSVWRAVTAQLTARRAHDQQRTPARR